MAYSDFSIESALAAPRAPRSYKLQGVSNAIRVLNSPSRSTEEFIQGAISSLGSADRQIMFVNSSLEALADRLRTAKKIADPINYSKSRGVEGFNHVPRLDPWAFALEENEGKGAWFKRIWQAIKTACRRVIDAIAHVLKWLANKIASLDTRAIAKDYKKYMDNKATVDKAKQEKEVFKVKINTPHWCVSSDGLKDFVQRAVGAYAAMAKDNGNDINVIDKFAKGAVGLTGKAKNPEEFNKQVASIFGVDGSDISSIQAAVSKKVTSMTDDMNNALKGDIQKVFKKSKASKVRAHDLVMDELTDGSSRGRIVEMTIGAIAKLDNGKFGCLTDGWLATNVTKVVSTVREQQKKFTEYTKMVDKVADVFIKTNSTADNKMKALASQLSNLSNARIRYNSFWTGLILEIESAAIRYRKTTHIALKHYLRAAKLLDSENKKASKKKSNESLSRYDVERLFDF